MSPGSPDSVGEEAGLAAAYGRLRPWAAAVLRLLVARYGPLPAEQEELAQLALQEGLSGAHVQASLRLLQSCGLVAAVSKGWKEHQYRVPEEHLTFWQKTLFPGLEPEPEAADGYLAEGSRNEPGDAVADVLQILLAASRGELKLLNSGRLAGQAVRKLERALLARNGELEGSGIAWAAPHNYGPAVSAALHMAVASGLLLVQDGCYKPDGTAAAPWLRISRNVLMGELYRVWKRAVAPSLHGWEFHALAAVETAFPGRWYPLNHLFDWLRVCGMMDLDCMAQMDFISTRLVPLGAWGWLYLEKRESGTAFMLRAPIDAQQDDGWESRFAGVVVQPDLEIIVPPCPPPALWWELLQWGEWTVRGEISVFRLTPRSIGAGRSAGGSAEALIGQLKGCSKVDIDEGVIRYIREQAGTASIGGPGVTGMGNAAPGPVYVPESVVVMAVGEESSHNRAARLAVEASLDPLPAEVPASWWTLGGRGHPSTEKEMIRRAIALRTALRITTADGQEITLVPLRLAEEAEEWEVWGMQGKLAVRLKPREWTGLRLVWPGIHE
ncbi:MAG: hypothetical protein K0Q90_934 [Paenibacillaceae bacterium]|jgi:hypothetical protein|nr:hypothetical protein [Paenibacillaceae bacterium]